MEDIRKIKPVRDFLLDIAVYDQFEEVAKKYGVPVERVDEFLQLSDAVIKGQITMDAMPGMIEKAFALKTKQAEALAADIVGYALLPLEAYVSGVADHLASWGARVADYPAKRVAKEKESPDAFVNELAQNIGLELPEHLMDRFRYLAKGYITKTRAKEPTKKILMRSVNIGGLDFTDAMAENFFKTLDEAAKDTGMEGEEVHPEVAKPYAPAVRKGVGEGTEVTEGAKGAEGKGEKRINKKAEANAPVVPDAGKVYKKKTVAEEMTKEELEAKIRAALPEGVSLDAPIVTDWEDALLAFGNERPLTEEEIEEARRELEEQFVKRVQQAKKVVEGEVNRLLAPVVEAFRVKKVAPSEFRNVVAGYVRGKQGRSDTEKRMKANYAFTATDVEAMMKALDRARALATGEAIAAHSEDGALTIAVSHELATSVPVINAPSREELEALAMRRRGRGVRRGQAVNVDVERAVNEALKPVAAYFKTHGLSRNDFAAIATAHVRGVRDAHQSESILKEKGVAAGDVGMLIKALQAARKVYEGASARGDGRAASAGSTDAQGKDEKDLLNRRFAAMTKRVDENGVEPVAPNARVSAARTKEGELASQRSRISEEAVLAAHEASKPKPARAKVSAGSMVEGGRVTDVRSGARLVGPVEELGFMRPAEFRRLSSDPEEAAQRVLDKLDLLQEASYEDRIKGVNAWRRSPINRLYLEMVKEALMRGKSSTEIATERRNAGKESLSSGEIRAIVRLNNKIKF